MGSSGVKSWGCCFPPLAGGEAVVLGVWLLGACQGEWPPTLTSGAPPGGGEATFSFEMRPLSLLVESKVFPALVQWTDTVSNPQPLCVSSGPATVLALGGL